MHKVSINDNQVYVLIAGALDVKQAAELRTDLLNLAEQGHKKFVINLSQTEYMDSTGLGVFVSLRNRLEGCGIVKILGLNGNVEQLFITTRLKEVFCE
jgi:anti-sigma B factor antagonist